ncbi:hypothetical protein [Nakamurella deserti]|uniref:hypothetical protein n=1 Tax=Nakamurella deserti TaxID=2164074 RepID=UPI000DBE7FE0|nr:hypothetical protein [Nakamurella deserti]
MANNEGFGIDPEDLDRMLRGAGEQLRGVFGQFGSVFGGDRAGWGGEGAARTGRPTARPETAGETGDGVWAVYTVNADGDARVEQVFATELDALRANKHNTDSNRKVRFLPYGIPVSVLDATEAGDGTGEAGGSDSDAGGSDAAPGSGG